MNFVAIMLSTLIEFKIKKNIKDSKNNFLKIDI